MKIQMYNIESSLFIVLGLIDVGVAVCCRLLMCFLVCHLCLWESPKISSRVVKVIFLPCQELHVFPKMF